MLILENVAPEEFSEFTEVFADYQSELLPYNPYLRVEDISADNIMQNYINDSSLTKLWIKEGTTFLALLSFNALVSLTFLLRFGILLSSMSPLNIESRV